MRSIRLLLASCSLLASLFLAASPASAQSGCSADLSGDGVVGAADLARLLDEWGSCATKSCVADLDASGAIDGGDLALLLHAWGCTTTVPAPTISSISPSQGAHFQQTAITITGANLSGATGVLVGGVSCLAVTVVDDSTVTAIVPPYSGPPVAYPLLQTCTVATPGGTAPSPMPFEYIVPSVTVSPQFAPTGASLAVVIQAASGSFQTGLATTVFLDGVKLYATEVAVVDAQTITAVFPSFPAAAATNITVRQQVGNSEVAWVGNEAFSYASLRYTVLDSLPDPTVVTDPTLRSAIVAARQPWRVRDNLSQLEFVLVPPGSFMMGCTDPGAGCDDGIPSFNDDNPPHPVTITYPFYMARCEVSQEQYSASAAVHGSPSPANQDASYVNLPSAWIPHLPLMNIQWQDSKDWFLTPNKLRFANEAEWEFACKAGTTNSAFGGTASPTMGACGNSSYGFPSGLTWDDPARAFVYSCPSCYPLAEYPIIGWNNLNSGFDASFVCESSSWSFHPIGICPVSGPGVTSSANPLGIYDMQGNVKEWVEDYYSQSGTQLGYGFLYGWYALMPAVDPGPCTFQQPDYPAMKVQRGGCVKPIDGGSTYNVPIEAYWRDSTEIADTQFGNAFKSFQPFSANLNNWVVGIRAVMDVQSPPVIQSVFPAGGSPAGGTQITVQGSNFADSFTGTSPSVLIGGAPATNVVLSQDGNSIQATVPPGIAGPSRIEVRTDVGVAFAEFYYIDTPAWAQVVEAYPDPTVVTDATLRDQITATGLPWHVKDTSTGIEMMLVPPGTFQMGCTPSDEHGCFASESPVHEVTISQPTYVGRYEVTQAQWTAKMGSNPSYFQPPNTATADANRPVEQVSWTTVQKFLAATGMRLPTEAEWEYACRAGTTTAFHGWPGLPQGMNDDTQVGIIAWYGVNAPGGTTQPVGQLPPNGFGIFDMAGNVSEWCSDWYSGSTYGSGPVVDPQGPDSRPGGTRVVRGSDIGLLSAGGPNYARSSCRDANDPDLSEFSNGFRVVRNP
jgi:formylglycine-generating enzyme required for sulfatase activity